MMSGGGNRRPPNCPSVGSWRCSAPKLGFAECQVNAARGVVGFRMGLTVQHIRLSAKSRFADKIVRMARSWIGMRMFRTSITKGTSA